MMTDYAPAEPSRAEVDQFAQPVLLEFGAPWCPICQAAQPLFEASLADHTGLQHLKIEDGKGRALGRSLRVKLWPTLVLMYRGQELGRAVRPASRGAVEELLALAPS